MIIIGITGASGGGKGTVVDYLKAQKGFFHFSSRGFLNEELKRRGLESNRDNLTVVSNDLRSKNSPSFIVEQLHQRAQEVGQDCIIESIRTVGEVEALRKIGHFYLFAVTADLPVRYERILIRGDATDNVSLEQFIEQNKKEESSIDPHKQNISACVMLADFILDNNKEVSMLYKQIDKVFKNIT